MSSELRNNQWYSRGKSVAAKYNNKKLSYRRDSACRRHYDVQGHSCNWSQIWYQSKADMRLPISGSRTIFSKLLQIIYVKFLLSTMACRTTILWHTRSVVPLTMACRTTFPWHTRSVVRTLTMTCRTTFL